MSHEIQGNPILIESFLTKVQQNSLKGHAGPPPGWPWSPAGPYWLEGEGQWVQH